MSEARPLESYREVSNNRQAADVPCWADLSERHAARLIVSAYTAWKLAGKPHVR